MKASGRVTKSWNRISPMQRRSLASFRLRVLEIAIAASISPHQTQKSLCGNSFLGNIILKSSLAYVTHKSYPNNGNSKMILMQDDNSMKGGTITRLTHSTSITPGFISGMCSIRLLSSSQTIQCWEWCIIYWHDHYLHCFNQYDRLVVAMKTPPFSPATFRFSPHDTVRSISSENSRVFLHVLRPRVDDILFPPRITWLSWHASRQIKCSGETSRWDVLAFTK